MVCVIDGDPAVRDSLATLMALKGLDVRTFSTGQEFLTALKRLTTRNGKWKTSSCIVCEAELPDTTGFEIHRALERTSPVPAFALLVSDSSDRQREIARKHGVQHVFAKPLVHRRLISFVTASSSDGSAENRAS